MQPMELTRARIPRFINSQARWRGGRQQGKKEKGGGKTEEESVIFLKHKKAIILLLILCQEALEVRVSLTTPIYIFDPSNYLC